MQVFRLWLQQNAAYGTQIILLYNVYNKSASEMLNLDVIGWHLCRTRAPSVYQSLCENYFLTYFLLTSVYLSFSQTVALWLKSTKYNEKHKGCFVGLQLEAYLKKVQLFQRKSVFDILWGYTDPFLKFLIEATKFPPPLNCPGREGMMDFVQLQVSVIGINNLLFFMQPGIRYHLLL